MIIANRLFVPDNTKAILWDMDGVLLDTLGLDLMICNQLLNQYFGNNISVEKEFIRSIFAHHPPEFWQMILTNIEKKYNIKATNRYFDKILQTYNQARNSFSFKLNPGIQEILDSIENTSLKAAVVSNNPTSDVKTILSRSNIVSYFDYIIGNDMRRFEKKPSPDTYLLAGEMLNIPINQCVVIEDSILGVEAGYRAKCFTIGVATGGDSVKLLEQSQWTDCVYSSFHPNKINIQFGSVTHKNIFTPNDFISHMIEHIAWRMGCEIDLYWNHNDWLSLGKALGEKIRYFEIQNTTGMHLGLIDDSSSEILIKLSDESDLHIDSTKNLDLDWFLSLRCEQVLSGKPLVELLKGLSQGLKAKIYIKVCSVEDPHHAWESIFRSIGVALNQIFSCNQFNIKLDKDKFENNVSKGDIIVTSRSIYSAEVIRETSESKVYVNVDFAKKQATECCFNVSSSINISGLQYLLTLLAEESGFTIKIDFDAKMLSSSHVLLEDSALVIGRALKEILITRMNNYGVNGAGSSIYNINDFNEQPIRVGLSVEGRKSYRFVPFNNSLLDIRNKFVIGQNVCHDLFSEDLDDFLDGLAGGLSCNIIIHIKELLNSNEGWQMIFKNLGKAIKEVFSINPNRKGVPPGVKATLS